MRRGLLIALLVLGGSSRIEAAVAHVQTIQAGSGSFNDNLTTGSFSTTAGNLLICAVMGTVGGTPPDVTSVATSTPQSLSLARNGTANTSGNEIWYLSNIAGGSITVTATWGGSWTYKRVVCTEVSGASTLDGTGTEAGSHGTTAATGSYTAGASSFWFASVSAGGSTAFSIGGGWTIPTNGSGIDDGPGAVAYYANPGGSSQNASFTITDSDWAATGVAFLEATSGTPLRSLLGVGR